MGMRRSSCQQTSNQLWGIHGDFCGREGIGETAQRFSASWLTSRPRKAQCIPQSVCRSNLFP